MQTYTTKELAQKCKCHISTILKDIHEGRLVAAKFGRSFVINQEAFDKYYEQSQYSVLQAMQAERNKKCLSTCEMEFGRLMLSTTAKELDDLLKQPAKRKPRNYMTK